MRFVPLTITNDEGEEFERSELVSDDPTPEEEFAAKQSAEHARETVRKLLPKLNERERLIVQARFLRDKPLLLEELAVKLGVTRERVRQIEQKTLARMRDELTGNTSKPLPPTAVAKPLGPPRPRRRPPKPCPAPRAAQATSQRTTRTN